MENEKYEVNYRPALERTKGRARAGVTEKRQHS